MWQQVLLLHLAWAATAAAALLLVARQQDFLVSPSAAVASTIRGRRRRACDHPRRGVHPLLALLSSSSSSSLSSSFSTNNTSNGNNPTITTTTKPFDLIRGEQYGADNNSTIPTATQAAHAVGVRPALEASAATWKRAWNIQKAALPVLHWRDTCQPPDSKLSLACLWWKALSATDPTSPVYDPLGLAYDMLPSLSRNVIQGAALRRLYPRLHHANVEIRTAFLDQSVTEMARRIKLQYQPARNPTTDDDDDDDTSTQQRQPIKKVRLISLGAGYDVRSIKLLASGVIDQAIELDLPVVVQAKTKLLERLERRQHRRWRRQQSRRQPQQQQSFSLQLPTLYGVDLNDIAAVESLLESILGMQNSNDSCRGASSSSSTPPTTQKVSWHTIFLFEGVMIYLNQGIPTALLRVCRTVLDNNKQHQPGSLCFADRLENIPAGDYDIAVPVLAEQGWNLTVWQPKPGLARHMGCAEMLL